MGQISGGPCHVMLGLGSSKNQDKKEGRYDSKTGAEPLQVTHAPSYQISSMERREDFTKYKSF